MASKLRLALCGFAAAVVAVGALNQIGVAVPGLEWVRADRALSAIGFGGTATQTGDATVKKSGGGGRRGGQDGPVPVVVALAATADVPVYLRGVGSARAPNTVTVKPQVDGKLINVQFREGQDVKKGDLLAEIDPVTYQSSLDQATAKRNLTKSQLSNAEVDLDRYNKVGPNVVAAKTIDTQRATVAQLQAQLRSDEAAIDSAKAVLGYTKLTAPLDGRTGQRLVDEGNLVRAGDAGIVTIAQIKPISVQFTLPQQQLAQVQAAMAAGPVQVEAMEGDDRGVIDSGSLTFIDNAIDPTTGTVKMKADLPNERLQLWPGQFANVRVRVDVLKQSVTAPTAAVQRGPAGTFVYVVGGDNAKQTVSVRAVVVAQQDDRVAVISKGLTAGEQVVTSGFARLKDQAVISITRTDGGASGDGKGKPAASAGPEASASDPKAGQAAAGPETGSTEPKLKPEDLRRAEGEGTKSERRGKRNKSQESAIQ